MSRGYLTGVQTEELNTNSTNVCLNPLKPKDPYIGHTAPLTSKRYILYIYSTNIRTEYFKQAIDS